MRVLKKKCKKCGKVLPDDYKRKLCEACLNEKADKIKKSAGIGAALLSIVLLFNPFKNK